MYFKLQYPALKFCIYILYGSRQCQTYCSSFVSQQKTFNLRIRFLWGDETSRFLGWDGHLVIMALLRGGQFTVLSLSIISGLAQEGGFLSRGQSETLEVGFLEVGNASGVFLSVPCPRENPSCRSNRPSLYRLYAGASLASQLWVPHLSLTVVR